jgi:hypothetical protein
MAKQTKIIIETESLLVLHGHTSIRAWCPQCGSEEEMVALESTAGVSEPGASRSHGMVYFARAAPLAKGRWLAPHLS